jgi:hypothetical protein
MNSAIGGNEIPPVSANLGNRILPRSRDSEHLQGDISTAIRPAKYYSPYVLSITNIDRHKVSAATITAQRELTQIILPLGESAAGSR